MTEFETLRSDYAALWKRMSVLPEKVDAVDRRARVLVGLSPHYRAVSAITGVPWFVIAVLHEREASANFATHLHNGDSLKARTTHVPAGRPVSGSPPFTWEASANDALKMPPHSLHLVRDWSIERIAYECEKYNGWGYRNKGVPSAYLWSFSNIYKGGKYVADGVWSSSAVDKQCGTMPLLARMAALDPSIKIGVKMPETIQSPPPVAEKGWLDSLLGLFKPKSAPSAAVTLPPTTVLKLGDKGPHVEAIQSALTDAGFFQYKIDGDFGPLTVKAVKNFQVAHNLDPDGEVGPMTSKELNARASIGPVRAQPVQPGPSPAEGPPWYRAAVKDIGFREVGVNRGIEKFIKSAKTGSLGDPWCAIWINAKLEDAGVKGSRSAMARSFEHSADFVKLSAPAIGCIVTMWRGSPSSGSGHVFAYDGESAKGVRGIGANEDDGVRRSFHERARITGYWWPKSVPIPKTGKIVVNESGSIVTSET